MADAAKAHITQTQTAHIDTFARDHLPPPDQWPEFIFTRPELQYPARLNCVVNFLDRWVEQGRGDAPCIFSPDVNYTYRELPLLVNRISNVLHRKLSLVTCGHAPLPHPPTPYAPPSTTTPIPNSIHHHTAL